MFISKFQRKLEIYVIATIYFERSIQTADDFIKFELVVARVDSVCNVILNYFSSCKTIRPVSLFCCFLSIRKLDFILWTELSR